VQRRIIRVRVIMTAANFSPAVASRFANNIGDFRVPTLLGAQLLDEQLFILFSEVCSRLDSAVPEGRPAHITQIAYKSHKFRLSPAAVSAKFFL
jgi:hypothetical protein